MFLSLLIPLPEWDHQGLEQDAFPCQLSCSGGTPPHPLTNARGWIAMERWYYSGRCWAETEIWWKAHSCGTVRTVLSVSKRHLSPQSAREGQFCRGVGYGSCSGVTWTWSSPPKCFYPMDSAHQPFQGAHRAPLPCSLRPPWFVSTCSLSGKGGRR